MKKPSAVNSVNLPHTITKSGDGKIQLDDPDTPNNESELLQENHYYPFGMVMEGEWTPQVGERNQYQYNGKEIDNDLGLDWYHYGFRMYDPAIGRFTGVDPLAEKYASWSSYSYVFDNPLIFIDPDGRSPDWYPEYDAQSGQINLVAEAGDNEASLRKWANGVFSDAEVSTLYGSMENGKIDLTGTFVGDFAAGFEAEAAGCDFNCFSSVESAILGTDKSAGWGDVSEEQFQIFASENLSESPANSKTLREAQPFKTVFGYTQQDSEGNPRSDGLLDHVSTNAGKDRSGNMWILTKDGTSGQFQFQKRNDYWGQKPDKVYQEKK